MTVIDDFAALDSLPPAGTAMAVTHGVRGDALQMNPGHVQVEGYTEKCPKCRGTGSFTSWSGRVLGRCHTCQGKGTQSFKTAPEVRRQAKAVREERRERAADEFGKAYAVEIAYLELRKDRWQFAADVLTKARQHLAFTDGQLAAVRSAMVRDAARAEERKAAAAVAQEAAPTVDISRVAAALQHAHDAGLKRPKLRLGAYQFSPAGASSRNPGAIYVTGLASDKGSMEYLGKIIGGKFIASRECTLAQSEEIIRLAAHPAESAVAYGQMTGQCACCGRELSDPESVRRGIGPICAEKFGF